MILLDAGIYCVILLDAGIGSKGETVSIQRHIFRTRLQPVGAAVYASPENIKEYEEINRLTKHEARKTQYALSVSLLYFIVFS